MSSPAPNLLMEALRYDDIVNCMRCGFCLTACPTYKLTGHEPKSPRGRIALARAAAEGQLSLADIAGPLDQCIGCRACETACPAGVQYGQILEAARTTITKQKPQSFSERLIRQVGLRWIMGTPAGIRLGGWALWLWQATGLAWLAREGFAIHVAGRATFGGEAEVSDPARAAQFPVLGVRGRRVTVAWSEQGSEAMAREQHDMARMKDRKVPRGLEAVGGQQVLVRTGEIGP